MKSTVYGAKHKVFDGRENSYSRTFKCDRKSIMYFTGLDSVLFNYKIFRHKLTLNNANNTKFLSFTEYFQDGLPSCSLMRHWNIISAVLLVVYFSG